MILNFIELTSYVGDPQGYADRPSFDGQLWPIFLKQATSIQRVLLFAHRLSNVSDKTLARGEYERVSSNIVSLGAFNQLSVEQLQAVAKLSFFGGHLSVLYQIRCQAPFLQELLGQYPNPPEPGNTDQDSLGLDEEARSELATLINGLANSLVVVGFAHDADPVYVFGNPATLANVVK